MKFLHKSKVKYNRLHKTKNKYKSLIKLVTLIGVLAVGYFVVNSFRISTISLKSNNNKDKLINVYSKDIINSIIGSNIFLFNKKYIIVGNGITFEITSIVKKYPNYLELWILSPTGEMSLKANNGIFLISNNGLVVEKLENNHYESIVILHDDLEIGGFVDNSVLSTVNSVLSNNGQDKEISIDAYNDRVVLTYKDGIHAVFPAMDNSSVILDKSKLLKKILRQYTIDSRGIDNIDLRYSKPVIKFK